MNQHILFGTDIILGYLLNEEYADGVSVVQQWAKRLNAQQLLDVGTISITTHFVKTNRLLALKGFDVIREMPPLLPIFKMMLSQKDLWSEKDERALLMQLNLIKYQKADILITENLRAHELSRKCSMDDKVFTMDEFIETCSTEHRDKDDSKGIILKEAPFGTLSLEDTFFNTFKREYAPYYYEWFKKKKDDLVYVAKDDCYMDMLRYKETRYENLEEGEIEYFLIGYVDTIQRVAVSSNGVITIYYRGDNQYESLDTYVQWLDDVDIQTSDDSDIEGTGDQRVHLTFNTLDEHGEHNTKVIGKPLNYIIETAISIPNNEHPDVPYCHLLVYYADPVLRALYQDKWVTYPSSKYPGQTWTEWVDIGLVRGVAGGLHIVKDVQSINELIDSRGNHIPPERLEDENDHVINPEAAGWSCSLTVWTYVESVPTNPNSLQIVPNGTSPLGERQIEIGDVEELNSGEFHIGDYVLKEKAKPTEILFYDYELKTWYSIGALDMSAVDPRYIIVKSAPQPGTQEPYFLDVELLSTHGIWLSAEKGISAY